MNKTELFKHQAITTADEDFLQSLTDYLSGDGVQATAPVFRKTDGTIDRERTLELPCYANLPKA
jgi:hypothetical protein